MNLCDRKETWTLNGTHVKQETFLQIVKQDRFFFSFLPFINDIKKENDPVQKFGIPFGLLFVTLKKYDYYNKSGQYNSRAERFILN